MDYVEDNDSIFDVSADLFDDTDPDLTVPVAEKTIDSQSLTSNDNTTTAVQAQDGSQSLIQKILNNTLLSTGVTDETLLVSSDNYDTKPERIPLFNVDAEESKNEHFNYNLHNQPANDSGASLEDRFENHPNKRHKLCEYVGKTSDYSDVDVAVNTNLAKFDILKVANHFSNKADICTVADQIAKDNKDSIRNLDKSNTNFATSSHALSLNENILNVGNKLHTNNEQNLAATNIDCSAANELNHLSLPQEMITDVNTKGFKGKTDSGRISDLQIPSTSSSVLPKTAKIICPFCNIHQGSLYLMEIHIDSMHSEISNDNKTEAAMMNNDFFVNNVDDFQFVCPLCDLDLGDRVTLELHLLNIHEEEHNLQACAQETCPLCGVTSFSEDNMKLHIQTHSADQMVFGVSENDQGAVFSASTTTCMMTCPVCGLEMADSDLLISHVESHFNSKHTPGPELVSGANSRKKNSEEYFSAKANATMEKDLREDPKARHTVSQNTAPSTSKEKLTPKSSRENLSYKRQYEQNLERAVTKGQMSVADYHEQKSLMAETDLMGVDNGSTRTPGFIEKLELLYHSQAHQGQVAHFCSPTDHFSGYFGDKGWGCGYRNFQMLLSCLSRHPGYAQKIFADNNVSIPSIPKIQQMIESAWKKGFDGHGCRQFGGRLVNTSQWIGATEIVATFSSLGVKCLLADFHAPSAPDGTHPLLLKWVSDYFCKHQQGFIPPLFLQHQGHSRTIVGVEKDCGITKLLLFDPGTPRDQMISIANDKLSWKHIRTFRRTQFGFKAKQYQIIEIVGLLTEEEYEESKILKSIQVS